LRDGDWILAMGDAILNEEDPVSQLIREFFSKYDVGDVMMLTVKRTGVPDPLEIEFILESEVDEEGNSHPSMGLVGISNLNSLQRFITVADQLKAVASMPSAQKIHYALFLTQPALRFIFEQIKTRKFGELTSTT
jgi:hypothetical protein